MGSRIRVQSRLIQFNAENDIALIHTLVWVPSVKVDRRWIRCRRTMKYPPVPRVQFPEFRTLAPAVVGGNTILHDSEKLPFQRKQTDGFTANRRQGEGGGGKFSRVESY